MSSLSCSKKLVPALILIASQLSGSLSIFDNCDWTDASEIGMGCLLFDGSGYLTWTEAWKHCYGDHNGSFLVEVLNEQQNSLLVAMAEVEEALNGGAGRNWWLGASDADNEGNWYWPVSLVPMNFSNWALGEPDGGITQNHALLAASISYEWFDVDDAYTGAYPICHKF